MLNCIIIEDQPPAQRILQKYIAEVEALDLKETFSDAMKAKMFLDKNEIDLIFLDINLPKISGIDYLLKPISFERFLQAIYKIETTDFINKTVFVKSGYDFLQINITDILYIKSDGDYTAIFTKDKTYLNKESLKYWLQKLPNNEFYQIHKSYIINTLHFTKISGSKIYLSDITLPIGRTYKKFFIDNYLG